MSTSRKTRLIGFTCLLALILAVAVVWCLVQLRGMRVQAGIVDDPAATAILERRIAEAEGPVLLLGDSRVAQWNPSPLIEGRKAARAGVGGITAVQLASALDSIKPELQGRTVVVQVGINDLKSLGYTDKKPDEAGKDTLEALGRVSRRLRDSGAKVVLTTIIPPGPVGLARMFIWSDSTNDVVARVNEKILGGEVVDDIAVVDLTNAIGSARQVDARYATDTLHVNEEAYKQLSRVLEQAMGQDPGGSS